jgi:predicted nucleic acid-binding protein
VFLASGNCFFSFIKNEIQLALIPAVRNGSPLGALDIIVCFFDKIYIPPAVYREVVEEDKENAHVDAILQHYSTNSLHHGELEALELALSINDTVVLLDDEGTRRIARSFNLHVKGTLGLLIDYNKAYHAYPPLAS